MDVTEDAAEQRFRDLTQRLDREPLARIMPGSRELFHSNTLAWIFERLPEVADAVFPAGPEDPTMRGLRRALRDRDKLDLVLERPGRHPVAIENRLFALPSRDRLRVLDSRIAGWSLPPAFRLVLGVSQTRDPLPVLAPDSAPESAADPVESPRWLFWSYSDLAARLDAAVPLDDDGYEAQTVRRYAALARLLAELIGATDVRDDEERAFLPGELVAGIESRPLRQALQKARAQRVAARLQQLVGDRARVTSSSVRGTAALTVSVQAEAPFATVGLQFQGGQVRRFATTVEHGKGTAARRRRAEAVEGRPELLALGEVAAELDADPVDRAAAASRRLGLVDPDLAYRYLSVSGLTVAQLAALVDRVVR